MVQKSGYLVGSSGRMAELNVNSVEVSMGEHHPSSIRHIPATGRRALRGAAYLACAFLAAAGMVATGKAPAAWACDSSYYDHCYAVAAASGPGNYGGYGEISDPCLYMPNDGADHVSAEIWDMSSNEEYWTEVGITSGLGYYHQWFWADSRPNGGGYNFHPVGGTASGGPLPVETTYVGNNQWYIYGGNSFTQLGTSINQPASSSGTSWFGTEYTVNPGAGMRDVGTISNLEWESKAGVWYPENGLAQNRNYGPPPPNTSWIFGNYNSSGDYETWNGPC